MENAEIMNSLHKPEQEYCTILSESMLYHPPITQALEHHDMNATVADYGIFFCLLSSNRIALNYSQGFQWVGDILTYRKSPFPTMSI